MFIFTPEPPSYYGYCYRYCYAPTIRQCEVAAFSVQSCGVGNPLTPHCSRSSNRRKVHLLDQLVPLLQPQPEQSLTLLGCAAPHASSSGAHPVPIAALAQDKRIPHSAPDGPIGDTLLWVVEDPVAHPCAMTPKRGPKVVLAWAASGSSPLLVAADHTRIPDTSVTRG
uniref:Uncharacterized protein n=1 Tax=Anopheles coluzzii TaxID=1518534 RepID=A0A8W7P4P5_ANOCL